MTSHKIIHNNAPPLVKMSIPSKSSCSNAQKFCNRILPQSNTTKGLRLKQPNYTNAERPMTALPTTSKKPALTIEIDNDGDSNSSQNSAANSLDEGLGRHPKHNKSVKNPCTDSSSLVGLIPKTSFNRN